jgi:hypothetical protein
MTYAFDSWLRERFPARNALLFAVFYATALLVARAGTTSGAVSLAWSDLPGYLALWSFFLTLRIADEHKDFDADAVAHPERVLQRGLVTLRQLEVVGAAALLVQAAVSLATDGRVGPVTTCWLITLAWCALMTREFFVREWLRRHLLVYAVSHMLVMPLATFWVATMAAPTAVHSRAVWVLAALSFLAGLAVEIARKIRPPELEHPLADSYTQALGVTAASAVLLGVVVATTAVALLLTVIVGTAGTGTIAGLGAALALSAAVLVVFRQRPTLRAAKRAEAVVGMAALTTHLVPIAALLAARGGLP